MNCGCRNGLGLIEEAVAVCAAASRQIQRYFFGSGARECQDKSRLKGSHTDDRETKLEARERSSRFP